MSPLLLSNSKSIPIRIMRAKIQHGTIMLVVILLTITSPIYLTAQDNLDNCRAQDSLVLADFYKNTLGEDWLIKWDLTQPIDTWYGVRLDENGCVTCLDLDGDADCAITVSSGNGLTGSIPSKIGQLDSLKILCLGNNRITGSIPSTLYDLQGIEFIDLFGNEIIGPLPANLGNATNLQILSLAGNNLIGPIPASIGQLQNLQELYLSNNNLIGPLPSSIGGATSLRRVRLNNNEIDGPIPPQVGDLSELVILNIAQNYMSGPIPAEMGQLNNLMGLFLEYNRLESDFPEELGNCLSLVQLRLSHNNISGELPLSLGNLSFLEQFIVNDNQLEGCIPPAIGQCVRLTDLRLDQNNLSCGLPDEMGNLVNLRIANFSHNQLRDGLPISIQNLITLQELDVSNNNLSEPIPAEITKMSSLKMLRAQDNRIIGPLPAGLDALERVIEVNLANNKIDGTIPLSYGQTIGLVKLYLNNNRLSGCFPETLSDDCDKDYNFTDNPMLPWEGDHTQLCAGNNQIEAPCSSDPTIQNETIQDDCSCSRFICTPVNIIQDAFLCLHESININGQEYEATGQVVETLETSMGCDSIVTYNIFSMDLSIQTENAQCADDETGSADISTSLNGSFDYSIRNEMGEEIFSGVDKSTLPSLRQILSPGRYQLTVRETNMQCVIDTSFVIVADHMAAEVTYIQGIQCDDQSYEINGASYDQNNLSGTEILKTINGCDSTVVIDLIYLSPVTTKIDAICENEASGVIEGSLSDGAEYVCVITDASNAIVYNETLTGEFNTGQNLMAGDYYIAMTTTDNDCVYTTQLKLEAQHSTPEPVLLIQEICQGEEIEMFGTIYNQENLLGTAIIPSVYGCDSTINIELEFFDEILAYDDSVNVESNLININVLENDEYDTAAELTLTIIDTTHITSVEVDGAYLNVEIASSYSGLSYIEYEICNTSCDEICSRARLTLLSAKDAYQTGVITPNGDGYNEVMIVSGYEAYEVIERASINIVNRWGQTVYSADEYKNDWSGNLNGDSSSPLPEGVYYYHLTYRNGASKLGSVSIIR